MSRLTLTPNLLTGMGEIEAQHRALVALANEVIDARSTAPPRVASRAVDALVTYDYHFACEEYVMSAAHFPREAAHRAWHGRLRREVQGLRAQIQAKGAAQGLVAQVQLLLEDWVLQHISHMDADLAAHLLQRGPVALPGVDALRHSADLAGLRGADLEWLQEQLDAGKPGKGGGSLAV